MKYKKWILLVVLIGIIGCKNNTTTIPTDENQTTIKTENKTIEKTFAFDRCADSNMVNLFLALETVNPDVIIGINFYVGEHVVNSYQTTLTKIDTAIFKNINIDLSGKDNTIQWTTKYEKNNAGYEIQRKYSNGSYIQIGYVQGAGNTNEVTKYSFKDQNLENDTVYYYRLKQISFDGSFEYPLEVKIKVVAIDPINTKLILNGVIKSSSEIAPDSGYTHNLLYKIGDLIYFKNANMHYGKIKLNSIKVMNEAYLRYGETNKNITYQLNYDIFIQTDGSRNGL